MRRWVLLLVVTLVIASAAQAADDPDQKSYPSLKIGGFSDFNFFASEEDEGDRGRSGFKEGQFVLHFVSEVADRIDFFGEVSMTAREEDDFKVELERGIIKYTHNDRFKVSFGRFHTPINWWNTAFHHGQYLQTSVARPAMTRFGGEFIPVHFVGAQAEGLIPSGSHNLKYIVGLGNGRDEVISQGGDAGDVNSNRAWLVNLSSKPDYAYGLQYGGAYYSDKITLEPAPGVFEEYDEAIVSCYVLWNRETPEVIVEYARVEHEGEDTGESFTSDAYYVQLAYRLPQLNSKLKPYARYEKIDVDEGQTVFGALMDRQGYLGGLRIDVVNLFAVKVEYRHQRTEDDPYVDAVWAQAAFVF